jgi:hypothetical protein
MTGGPGSDDQDAELEWLRREYPQWRILWDVQDRLHVVREVPLRSVPHAARMGIRAPALSYYHPVNRRLDPLVVYRQDGHCHFIRQPRVACFGDRVGVASHDALGRRPRYLHRPRPLLRVL